MISRLKRELHANTIEVVEMAMLYDGFEKMNNRTNSLTSDRGWRVEVETYTEGWYLKFTGTRSSFNAFIIWGGDKIRKPKNLGKPLKVNEYCGINNEITDIL
jgi:hypothetical protein